MHYFNFKRNILYCEALEIKRLAQKFSTPLYVYSARTIEEHFNKLKRAFKSVDPLICYSVKANSNLSILKLLVLKGAGLDIVSGGELYRAKEVGCPGEEIVYASVGKTGREIRDAIRYGIFMFNVESLAEARRINSIARRLNRKTNVSLRLNPDVSPGTHAYITTGKKETKFGMDYETVKKAFLDRKAYTHLNLVGIHIHIGSQITRGTPFVSAIKKARKLIRELKAAGVALKFFNLGGGLGIVYAQERPQTAQQFARKVLPLLKGLSLKIILEPGRFIVGNAGILVTKVIYVKDAPGRKFVIVDAAMNDLLRPALYDAYHRIVPVIKNSKFETPACRQAGNSKLFDVVGPVCESGDFLGKRRRLNVTAGDYIAVFGAGAYGFSMSSNYNSRPRAAEVLVNGQKVSLIRSRENYRDLIRGERAV